MAIIHDQTALDDYLLGVLPSLVPSDVKARYPNDKTGQINTVLGKNPLLFDRYLADAIEIDVDALSDGEDGGRRRDHGAYRGGRHSLGRQRLLAAAAIAHARDDRAPQGADAEARARARSRRPDERAIRAEGRRDLRARGQSARLAHRALRRQGDRQADRQDREPAHGGREAQRFVRSQLPQARPCRGQGGGVPVRPLPWRRHRARAGNALDRRGDGDRPLVRDRFRQEPDRRGLPARRSRARCSFRCATPTRRGSSSR